MPFLPLLLVVALQAPPPVEAVPAAVHGHPATRRGLELFAWFADGWLAYDPDDPTVIADVRYSYAPTRFASIWGVRLTPDGPGPPVEWVNNRRRHPITWRTMLDLLGGDATEVPLPPP